MTPICLDTSAYSNFQRGSPAVAELVRSSGRVLVPTIVLGELRTGFQLGTKRKRNESELRAFLAHPAVEILVVDDEAASRYAGIFVGLRRAGTPLPTNDIWIAALAAREGAIVLTYDAHFEKIRCVQAVVLTNEPG